MQIITLLLFILLLPGSVFAEESDRDLMNFLVGSYQLIGKAYESDQTYSGQVTVSIQKDHLKVARIIHGKEITGTGRIETSDMTVSKVLRIRFTQDGIFYEETCLYQGDLDNYARVTCYLYRPGIKTEAPGMEALFINQKK